MNTLTNRVSLLHSICIVSLCLLNPFTSCRSRTDSSKDNQSSGVSQSADSKPVEVKVSTRVRRISGPATVPDSVKSCYAEVGKKCQEQGLVVHEDSLANTCEASSKQYNQRFGDFDCECRGLCGIPGETIKVVSETVQSTSSHRKQRSQGKFSHIDICRIRLESKCDSRKIDVHSFTNTCDDQDSQQINRFKEYDCSCQSVCL